MPEESPNKKSDCKITYYPPMSGGCFLCLDIAKSERICIYGKSIRGSTERINRMNALYRRRQND